MSAFQKKAGKSFLSVPGNYLKFPIVTLSKFLVKTGNDVVSRLLPGKKWLLKPVSILALLLVSLSSLNAQNAIVTENALTGNPQSEWDISGAGDLTIQGFATDISVNKGTTVQFKIKTDASAYTINIYRLGYYNKMGARKVATITPLVALPQVQPTENYDPVTGMTDCGNWAVSAQWAVPSTAVSGVYIARLRRNDNGGASHIVFIVRDDASTSDILFQTSDATWHAYNIYGGHSLYLGNTPTTPVAYPNNHASKVSYNRPFVTRNGGGGGGVAEDFIWNAEYPMIRWLERNGYNVTYFTNVDAVRSGTLIKNHKTFFSVGHDEYWSAEEYNSVIAARNAGVNLAFFSGNEVYWKTRYENSTVGTVTPNRTLVCYKEGTLGEASCGGKCDPNASVWTGLWRDGSAFPAADGNKPENALTGQISWKENQTAIEVPDTYKNYRFWRNTNITSLAAGAKATLADGSIGYEWDFDQPEYASKYPAGRMKLSSTNINGFTHNLSLYKHSSGALVFGAGTVQWAWGLDSIHDRGLSVPDIRQQQATVNLLADMGVQPGTRQTNLVAATKSTDVTAPVVTISFPANGATLSNTSPIVISGTATDAGGIVAGVEVSTDGGTTWQPVTGTTNWTYSWATSVSGAATIKVRGYDDSGNLGVPGASGSSSNINVTLSGTGPACPCTIFQTGEQPSSAIENDGSAIEVGVKFNSVQAGYITGVRFYKTAGNSGTHIGHLWSSTGAKLAEATFTGETASGWQQVLFTTPVAITANTTYIASYFSSAGNYTSTSPYFDNAKVSGTLKGLANGEDGVNGVYTYSATSAFPTNSFQASNYWADAIFNTTQSDVTPPTVVTVTPANAATGVASTIKPTAVFSEAMTAATISTSTVTLRDATNVLITTTVAYNTANNTVTITPSAALANSTTYTAKITGGASGVKDAAGNALAATYSWQFTTGAPDVTPPTVSTVTPANGETAVSTGIAPSIVFSEPMTAATITTTTVQLRNASNVLVTATVAYNSTNNTATITPSAPLGATATYTATITGGASGVKDAAGNALAANYTWSFTTGAAVTSTLFLNTESPATGVDNDGIAIETGLKFRSTQTGYITGIRFYKVAGNSGTHIGHLWSNTGTKLAEATFTGETASGWQQVIFSTPVAIAANTTYVASYFSSTGAYTSTVSYFATAKVNGSLRGLANGEDGVNGIYKYSATSAFPTDSYSASNYWTDVIFTTSIATDNTPPTVTSVNPTNGSTGISIATNVSAVFSEPMTAASITATTVQLRNASNVVVGTTLNFNAATNTVTLTPTATLAASSVYNIVITGGASGVKDVAGNPLAATFNASFTTAAGTTLNIFQPTDAPPLPPFNDATGIELGVKFRVTQSGYITGVRFYKGDTNIGTHIGHLWGSDGSKLAEATFTNETASGWQTVLFATPVAVSINTTYTASYFSSAGIYSATNPYFTSAVVNGPVRALATGEDGGNGVYIYSATPAFPTNSNASSNYWADIVYTSSLGPDVTPPVVSAVTPASGAANVSTTTTVTANFNESIDPATVSGSTVELRTAANVLVTATVSYNISTNTVTITPGAALTAYTSYTAKIKGGTTGVKDISGNALAADYSWSFAVGDPPPLAPTEGFGGPILVISNTANPFSRYATEILRTEGLNEFNAVDISTVTATVLNNYDVVVLGEVTVTSAQVTLLTNWVNAGGKLIAFRPSALLCPLLGISTATGTLADKYLLVNTNTGPGVGIVNQTIQFHGTADLHTLTTATSLATLYSSATAVTTNPAVTTRSVGLLGGRAIAFTYDLAKSVVYTRQGNPAKAATETDGQTPIRPDDLFFPDYVDMNKIAIPQADEQQRLLANIIIQANLSKKPLPRFWYMPNDNKAAVVYTVDDHGTAGGTADVFGRLIANSTNGCSLDDWGCYRATSWFYLGIPLSNNQASIYNTQGFELGAHVQNGCVNFSSFSDLDANYITQLQQFQSAYPSLAPQTTHRFHCIVWSDWLTQAKVELSHGIRYSMDYYYWPPEWIQGRPGLFTGSGMPMRFADTNGSMVDVYQGVSQLVNENGIDYNLDVNTLLDNATNANGYYGFFGTHDDCRDTTFSSAIITSAKAHNVPVISARQALTWLDGRNNSYFSNMTWSNNTLTFNIFARNAANNLRTMVPVAGPNGQLISIKMNGSAITYTTQTIKGIQYAFFTAARGNNSYAVAYNTSLLGGLLGVLTQDQASVEGAGNQAESLTARLEVSVMPNPSNSYFNLFISNTNAGNASIRVFDMFGRAVEKHENVPAGRIQIGQSLATGTYFAEVIKGSERKVLKLIKAN